MVQAAVRGVLPATVGLGLLTGVNMARSLLAEGSRESKGSLLLGIGLLVGSGLAASLGHWPVVVVLLAGGAMGAVGAVVQNAKRGEKIETLPEETEPPAT